MQFSLPAADHYATLSRFSVFFHFGSWRQNTPTVGCVTQLLGFFRVWGVWSGEKHMFSTFLELKEKGLETIFLELPKT